MSHVRAKFKCWEKCEHVLSEWDQEHNEADTNITVKMSPVQGDPIFGKSTPSGSLEMRILNKAAADAFVLGQEYYVDFTPVPAQPEPEKDIRTL